jgi:hypothetical protein
VVRPLETATVRGAFRERAFGGRGGGELHYSGAAAVVGQVTESFCVSGLYLGGGGRLKLHSGLGFQFGLGLGAGEGKIQRLPPWRAKFE